MIPTTPVNKGFGFLFEMGCGKTLTAIAVAGAGYQQKRISRVLIVAPTSVVAVWPKEFQDYAAFPYTIRTLLGTKQQRLKALADLERFPYPHLKVAVINYESTWREEIFDALLDFDADLVIADESQRIKSHDAAQSKAMHQLGDKARYKLILSGTPVQNEAVDLWSQYRFLDPTIFGTNFYAFRSRYCEMGGFNRKQIVRYRDLDTLIRKEHSICWTARFTPCAPPICSALAPSTWRNWRCRPGRRHKRNRLPRRRKTGSARTTAGYRRDKAWTMTTRPSRGSRK